MIVIEILVQRIIISVTSVYANNVVYLIARTIISIINLSFLKTVEDHQPSSLVSEMVKAAEEAKIDVITDLVNQIFV